MSTVERNIIKYTGFKTRLTKCCSGDFTIEHYQFYMKDCLQWSWGTDNILPKLLHHRCQNQLHLTLQFDYIEIHTNTRRWTGKKEHHQEIYLEIISRNWPAHTAGSRAGRAVLKRRTTTYFSCDPAGCCLGHCRCQTWRGHPRWWLWFLGNFPPRKYLMANLKAGKKKLIKNNLQLMMRDMDNSFE